jgi:hypothetical protein
MISAKIEEVAKTVIRVGLSVVAVGILLQVIFGAAVPFFGSLNIVGTLTDMLKNLGSQGLVGVLACGVILWLFNTKKPV